MRLNSNPNLQSNSLNTIPDHLPGQRCVQKVVMEERMEYEEVMECNHSYDRRCFTSLATTFTPTQVLMKIQLKEILRSTLQEEECRENYLKECFITNTAAAENITVSVCRKPLVKDCDLESDDQTCSTQYEAECVTSQHVHLVGMDKVNRKHINRYNCTG